jgi:hypothetical protein
MNCKQGDLAIIISGGNCGKIVEVVRLLGEHPAWDGYLWNLGDGPCWLAKAAGQPIKIFSYEDGAVIEKPSLQECPVPDMHLRPIRGDELDEDTSDVINREDLVGA